MTNLFGVSRTLFSQIAGLRQFIISVRTRTAGLSLPRSGLKYKLSDYVSAHRNQPPGSCSLRHRHSQGRVLSGD